MEKKTKEKVLGIRLKEEDFERFDQFCTNTNMNKSQVARIAILKYMYIIYNPLINPKLIFSKSQLRHCFQCMTESEIEELVEISIQNGTYDMKKLEEYHPKTRLENEKKTEVNYQFETLVKYVFSDEGEDWFNEIKYQWENNTVKISGTHVLGPNFSFYIKELLKKYTIKHNFHLQEEISSNIYKDGKRFQYIELTFQPKIEK